MVKKLIIFIVVVLVGAGGFMAFEKFSNNGFEQAMAPASNEGTSGNLAAENENVPDVSDDQAMSQESNVIIYTDEGFSPNPLTVKVGNTVTFRNQGSRPVWPASAMHPTHKVYPGSDIEKCGTADESGIFDACRGIEPGGEWRVTFVEAGNWKYHDHLNTSKFGTIVVE